VNQRDSQELAHYVRKMIQDERDADRVRACVLALAGIDDPAAFVKQAKTDRARVAGLDGGVL
jgi:hypothetical protein